MKKKVLGMVLCVALVGTLLSGCGDSAGGDSSENMGQDTETEETDTNEANDSGSVQIETDGYQINTELDLETEITLDIVGPGVLDTGEEGTEDLISGLKKPGYNVLVERWEELYPNVTLNINTCPWDNWESYITTACLDGNADVILHGGTLIDLTEDLTSYFEADSEYQEQIYALATRRTTEHPDQYKISGVSACINPLVVWVDTEKFENFGVELPSDDWTIEDMKELAERLTGTDPVTGEEVYGMVLPFTGSQEMDHLLVAQIYGAKIYEYGPTLADCKVNYLSDESVRAFETIAEFSQYISPVVKEGTPAAPFGENDWAIKASSASVMDYLTMKASGLEGRYKAYNFPVVEVGENAGSPSPAFFDNNIAVYKDSDAKEWAWEFIKFMTTDKEAVQWMADTLRYPNNVRAQEFIGELLDERTASVIEQSLKNLPENYTTVTNDCHNSVSFGPTVNNLRNVLTELMNGRMTGEEAAQFMQDGVEEYLSTVE